MSGYAKLNNNKDWNTPKKYCDAVKDFFEEIDLDPCSNDGSILECKIKYQLPEQDGLILSWMRHTFVNPPYGTGIKSWFKKAYSEYQNGNEILMLVPVATNTSHWKEWVYDKAAAICFIYDTRLKFRINGNENNKGAPMACCFIYYGNNYIRFSSIFSSYGYCVKIS